MQESTQVLVVDDNDRVIGTWSQLLCQKGYRVIGAAGPREALFRLHSNDVGLVFSDMRMNRDDDGLELLRAVKTLRPATPFVLYTSGNLNPADAHLANEIGADAFLSLPIENERMLGAVRQSLNKPRGELHTPSATERLICASEAMQSLCARIDQTRGTTRPTLISGETGTGKELLARYIHAGSCAKGPFIAVNCGGISPALAESTLFGHRKGAFTSADSPGVGLVEAARGGTLFLDEVGELPLEIQATFLRVLDVREYRRVGEVQTRHLDARILAATNRHLHEEVRVGRFRKDLYYRLEAAHYYLPPLRARHDDLLNFVERWRFRAEWQYDKTVTITGDGRARLCMHDWPGNFRELHHVLDRASDLARLHEIGLREIELALAQSHDAEPLGPTASVQAARTAAEVDRSHLLTALERNRWKMDKTAKSLGMNRWKLRRVIKSLGIDL